MGMNPLSTTAYSSSIVRRASWYSTNGEIRPARGRRAGHPGLASWAAAGMPRLAEAPLQPPLPRRITARTQEPPGLTSCKRETHSLFMP